MNEENIIDMQHLLVNEHMEGLEKTALHLFDRARYYDEPVTLEAMENLLRDIQRIRKIMDAN